MMKLVAFLALISGASAACPNSCSGHGTCGLDDVCTCYQGWGMGDENSGDCSEQFCPYEIAFVDHPNADGLFHKYMECSGKGLCDRSTGECECFEGYSGKGCQRQTCPNDCSGHGTCEYIEELGYGPVWGEYASYVDPVPETYSLYPYGLGVKPHTFDGEASQMWDYHKSMACVCDGGYTDVDCSRRMCPKGNDVMDERMNLEDKVVYQTQNITLYAAGTTGNGTGSQVSDFHGKTFALTFTSLLNESYTTIPIYISTLESNITHDIALALKSLPNGVINNVDVNSTFGYEDNSWDGGAIQTDLERHTNIAFLNFEVTFTGTSVQGKQNLLEVEADKCEDGCTPKITGLDLISIANSEYVGGDTTSWQNTMSFVSEKFTSDYNNYECGRRGKCDYDSGICECFEGYTGEGCSVQTALV